jgi:hypothetical protein
MPENDEVIDPEDPDLVATLAAYDLALVPE